MYQPAMNFFFFFFYYFFYKNIFSLYLHYFFFVFVVVVVVVVVFLLLSCSRYTIFRCMDLFAMKYFSACGFVQFTAKCKGDKRKVLFPHCHKGKEKTKERKK